MQEDWKVTPRLTLNLGLRYEFETPWTERYNRGIHGFDSSAKLPVSVPGMDVHGGLEFAGVNGIPRGMGKIDPNNLAPRVGLAYSINRRTVMRAGYGLFYSAQTFNNNFGTTALSPFIYIGPMGGFEEYLKAAIQNQENVRPFPTGRRPRRARNCQCRGRLQKRAAIRQNMHLTPN